MKEKHYSYNPYSWRASFKGEAPIFSYMKNRKKLYKLHYDENVVVSELAVTFDVTTVTIRKFMKRMHWQELSIIKYPYDLITKCHDFYSKGNSLLTVSEKFDVPKNVLAEEFRKRGFLVSRDRFWHFKQIRHKLCDYSQYRNVVSSLSYKIENCYQWYIGKPFENCHMDHRYSTFYSYYNPDNLKYPAKLIELCHPVNLQYLTASENCSKKRGCSVSLSKLREEIRAFNKKHGNPFVNTKFEQYLLERFGNLDI